MRLINTKTLKLHEFLCEKPPYAILSHTWGKNELSLQEYDSRRHLGRQHETRGGPGLYKILDACRQARGQGLDYVWVDTCCIDKTNSAELGEAINSMFKWYQDAAVCYALLEDLSEDQGKVVKNANDHVAGMMTTATETATATTTSVGFSRSRWFTRGWTLQELIAPRRVEFFDGDWSFIGEKKRLAPELQSITGVDSFILEGGSLQQVSVARRMSWAAYRETRRPEDIAYSLLGLFDVNMPLVYGEGSKAFLRLQEEILKQSDDHTIFAWRAPSTPDSYSQVRGLFASSPREFQNFLDSPKPPGTDMRAPVANDRLVRIWDPQDVQEPITMTNKGIKMVGQVQDLRPLDRYDTVILVLNCSFGGDPMRTAGIYLSRQRSDRYARVRPDELASLEPEGRHISRLKLYGLRHEGEVRGHHYDQPWTTSYKIRRELTDKQLHRFENASTLGSRYEQAFYLERRSLKPWTIFGQLTLYGVVIADSKGLLRFFRFDPNARHVDIVLKTYNNFRVALMLRSDDGSGTMIVFLGRNNTDATGIHSTDITGVQHWINTMSLSKEDLQTNSSKLLDFMASSANADFTDKKMSLKVMSGGFRIYGEIVSTQVEGIPMQAIKFRGPWPVSLLPLLAWFGPVFLRHTFLLSVFGGLLYVVAWSFEADTLWATLDSSKLFAMW